MRLREMIEKASKTADNQADIAKVIGVSAKALTEAKAERRGLPAFACVRLAQMIGEDERRVIAASELVTEKNPERRAVWLPFISEIAEAAKRTTARTVKGTGEAIISDL